MAGKSARDEADVAAAGRLFEAYRRGDLVAAGSDGQGLAEARHQ